MVKKAAPHPTLLTDRLCLRQFRAEDADAMHRCFTDAEAMRFWHHPVHTKRIETERTVRRCIECTPSYYRFWAVADAKTDRCLGMVTYHHGHIRNKRVEIGYIIDLARHRQGIATEAVAAMQAYFAEENPIKRDGIAVRQLRALRVHQGPRDKKPRLSDVKEMFLEMKKISRVK